MGNCDSSNQYLNNRRDSSKFVPNYSSPSLPVVTSLKEKKYNLISHKSKKNYQQKEIHIYFQKIFQKEKILLKYIDYLKIFLAMEQHLFYILEKKIQKKNLQ